MDSTNYPFYPQMSYYPPPPSTDVKPAEPNNEVNQPIQNKNVTIESNTAINTTPLSQSQTTPMYSYSAAEYYYYQNYYNYYNQFYGAQFYGTQNTANMAPPPAPPTNDAKPTDSVSKDNTVQSPEGAVFKPLDQPYPPMFYPPNYSVPPPIILPTVDVTPLPSKPGNFWNQSYQNKYKPENAAKSAPVTPVKPVVKQKNSTRPSRFQSPSSGATDKVAKPAAAPIEKTKKNVDWPDSLKAYVQRAFNSVNDKDKDKMQELLKEKLEAVYSKDMVGKIDWGKEPLPLLKSTSSATELRGTSNSKKTYVLQKPKTYTPSISRSGQASTSKSNRKPLALSGRNSFKDRISSRSSSRSSDSRHHSRRRKYRKRSRSNSSNSLRNDKRSHSRESYDKREIAKRKKYRKSSSDSEREKPNPWINDDQSYGSPPPPPMQTQSRIVKKQQCMIPMSARLNITVNNINNINKKGKGKKKCFIRKNQPQLRSSEVCDAVVSPQILANRASRFKAHLWTQQSGGNIDIVDVSEKIVVDDLGGGGESWEDVKIVGTCQSLEKRYLRLTKAPDPDEVRPVDVLRGSLEHIKKLWYDEKLDYRHVCEQLKSVRQDLTVQCVRDDFTLLVYKTHATIALEAGDHEEFNQCQSQIKLLYEEGIPCPDYLEFTSYRLIYYMFTRDFLNIGTVLSSLLDHHHQDPCVAFAVKLRRAWSLNNYRRFFQLASGKKKKSEEKCNKINEQMCKLEIDVNSTGATTDVVKDNENANKGNEKINSDEQNFESVLESSDNKNDLKEISDGNRINSEEQMIKNEDHIKDIVYEKVPKLCGRVVSWFLERERKAALRSMIKAYRPWLDLSYVSDILGFSSVEECLVFITSLLGDNGHDQSELFLNKDVSSQKLDMKMCAAIIPL